MLAAAIFGLGCSPDDLKPFQAVAQKASCVIDWSIGLPSSANQADIILLFGGDGTIHRHLNALVKLNLPVLIVPSGSGNDFARALGLRRLRDSLSAWRRFCERRDNIRAIDLGVITPLIPDEISSSEDVPWYSVPGTRNYFATVAGLGLSSEVARRANSLPRWLRGHGGYALTLTPTLFNFAPFAMKISVPAEKEWMPRSNQPTILAAFANTSTYGDGMKIAPHAQMDDGQLDICVIGAIDRFKLSCLFPTVYFGRHLSIREVDYFQSARVRVETGSPLDVYADGEYVCRTPVEVAIEPRVLRVLTP